MEDRTILEDVFQIKTYNDDAKKITQRLLNEYIPIDQHNQILNETDRTIISLLYHENVVDPLWEHVGSKNPEKAVQFYNQFLDNLCFADYIDRVTFQNQIWIFNEMSSMMKTFYNNWLYHDQFPELAGKFHPPEVRFTKVLTKYSTEYNNQLFLYNMCQELDMDKKDVIAFFQELRLLLGGGSFTLNTSTAIYEHLDDLFQSTDITRLDIKRMYRFLDKNSETFDLIGGKRVNVASVPHMEDGDDADGGTILDQEDVDND